MKCMKCKERETVAATTTYFAQLEDYYVIIEHVPCMRCEQCGEQFFSTSVMERIEIILEKIEKKEESILVLDYDTAA